MAYKFNETELEQIRQAHLNAQNGIVPWWTLYQTVSALIGGAIERGDVSSSDLKDVEAAKLWFDGAVEVNQGTGVFSSFIRAYTAKQFELRYGSSSIDIVINKMQMVSDRIAEQVVYNDIILGGGVLPSMTQLALSDASIAGALLFSSLGGSAAEENSAWSGVYLFSMFGTDQSWRIFSSGEANKLDTIGDLRDLLFAHEAFGFASVTTGIWDEGTFRDVPLVWNAIGSWFNSPGSDFLDAVDSVFAGFNNRATYWESALTIILQDHTALQPVHWLIRNNIGTIKSQLEDLLDIDVGSSWTQTFEVALTKLSSETKITLIDGLSTGELVNGFKNDKSIQYAIENVYAFSINDSSLYTSKTFQSEAPFSDQYVNDRVYVYQQLLDAQQQDSIFVTKGVLEGTANREFYYDAGKYAFTSDVGIFATPENMPLNVKKYIFGGKSGEKFVGGDRDDRVYSNDGDDSIFSGGGDDFIEGGGGNDSIEGSEGYDTYNFKGGFGNDTVIDSDKSGIILVDGSAIGVLYLVSAGHYANARFSAEYVKGSGTITVTAIGSLATSGSITINEWENGNLGVAVRENPPPPPGDEPPGDDLPPPPPPPPPPPIPGSPLVLDLDGDGIETVGMDKNIHFDHAGDSFRELTGFVAADDGLLVLDRNLDGRITSGNELFGNSTKIKNNNFYAENGFLALADFDSNKDSYIDSADSVFSKLRIWRDLNQDGNSDAGELFSLSEYDVERLSLQFSQSSNVDVAGNAHRQIGSYIRSDGQEYAMTDVWFATNPTISQADLIPVSSIISDLPDAKGFGVVNSLHQAMMRDVSGVLKGLVEQFVGSTSREVRVGLLEKIIFSWTKQSGEYRPYHQARIDARKIGALEAFWGYPLGLPQGSGTQYTEMFNKRFDQLEDIVFYQLTSQTYLNSFFNAVEWSKDEYTGLWEGDFSGVIDDLLDYVEANPSGSQEFLEDFIQAVRGVNPYNTSNLDYFQQAIYSFIQNEDTSAYSLRTLTLANSASRNAVFNSELIMGDENTNSLFGLSGNDTLNGAAGNDELDGGFGDDILIGGAGADVFHFGRGYQHDRIQIHSAGDGVNDVVKIANDLVVADIDVFRQGDDLIIKIKNTNDVLRIESHFADNGAAQKYISAIVFADNSKIFVGPDFFSLIPTVTQITSTGDDLVYGSPSADEILALSGEDTVYGGSGDDILSGGGDIDELYGDDGADVLSGNDGEDVLHGGNGNDSLHGDSGEDYLYGEKGDDTYFFELGDGLDVISDQGNASDLNSIIFGNGILLGDLHFRRSADDLIITNNSSSDQIRVQQHFSSGSIKSIIFNDALNSVASLNYTDIEALTMLPSDANDELHGGNIANIMDGMQGKDTIKGEGGNDTIYGGADDDVIYGDDGNDLLNGDAGNDVIYDGSGDDTLDGGAGNDVLYGGEGNEIYIFGFGSGQDRIENYDTNTANIDAVHFGEGVTANNTVFKRDNDDLLVLIPGTTDSLRITKYFYNEGASGYTLDSLVFAGDDVWNYDRVYEYVSAGTEMADIIFGNATDNTISSLGGNDQLYGRDGDDSLSGGAGADSLYGDDGNDRLDGGSGNDFLSGGLGSDTYFFGIGGGQDRIDNYESGTNRIDQLHFTGDLSAEDVVFSRDKTDLIVSIKNTSDSIRISHHFYGEGMEGYQLDALVFSGGDVWNYERIYEHVSVVTESNDEFYGNASNNVIDALGGDDQVYGKGGDDFIAGGAGADFLSGDAGSDTLDGGVGNDTLSGGGGNDVYLFGRGGGSDQIDNYDAGVGRIDQLHFAEGIVFSDVEFKRDFENLIISIKGTTDSIKINNYFYRDGVSPYQLNILQFSDGDIWDYSRVNEQVSAATELNDHIYGDSANNIISGLGGDDRINGNDGDDYLSGDAGNDWLNGGSGSDTLDGGEGDDVLSGGFGNDVYLFNIGDGSDRIENRDSNNFITQLRFGVGISAENTAFKRVNNDLYISILNTTDTIRVVDYFLGDGSAGYKIDEIKFVNGSFFNYDDVYEMVSTGTEEGELIYGNSLHNNLNGLGGNDYISGGWGDDLLLGGAGDDYLDGEGGNDTLDGGSGNDQLLGGSENNVFLFGLGGGQDTINYSTTSDQLHFTDIQANEVHFTRQNDDLIVAVLNTTDSIRVKGYFSGDGLSALSTILFPNGDSWNYAEIYENVSIATNLADTIYGDSLNNTITGLDGNDQLYGRGGNDYLTGGAGIDSLYGEGGNDTLDGGSGNDILSGGDGSDTYLFGIGSGQDVINNYDVSNNRVDILQFTGGLSATDIEFKRESDDLIISLLGSTDSVRVVKYFQDEGTAGYKLGALIFADNDIWNYQRVYEQVSIGTSLSDIIYGNASNNNINGMEGNDQLFGRAGNDSLTGGTGADSLYGEDGNDTLDGGSGNDFLSGGGGNDVYLFGLGSGQDQIVNRDDNSSRIDQLHFGPGITANDVVFKREGDDLIVSITGTTDSVRIAYYFNQDGQSFYRLNSLVFAGGDNWDYSRVYEKVVAPTEQADIIYGDSSNNVINGLGGDDFLYGADGNDTLDGGVGDDTLLGGLGNDVYLFGIGGGQDKIENVDNSLNRVDELHFGENITAANAIFTREYDSLRISISGTTDSVFIQNYFFADGLSDYRLNALVFADGDRWDFSRVYNHMSVVTEQADSLYGNSSGNAIDGLGGNDQVYGRDGNDSLTGGAGADSLYGENGNDTLDGGVGNDLLVGGEGNDIYRFGIGGGNDLIQNFDSNNNRIDELHFGEGINAANVVFTRQYDNLIISITGTADSVQIHNYFYADGSAGYHLNALVFADGDRWDYTRVNESFSDATELPDAIYGNASPNTIDGLSGDDQIFGRGGNDSLIGGAGADSLYGEDGNDVLDGGVGNDVLNGGIGNDIYHFSIGGGNDIIQNFDASSGRIDELHFGEGINAENVKFSRDGEHLTISITGTSDSIQIQNYFSGEGAWGYHLNAIVFADGDRWDYSRVSLLVSVGTELADTLYGFSSNDLLAGNGGDDQLYGREGSDTLDGGAGNDTLDGGAGNDVYLFGIGSGQDRINNYDPNNLDELHFTGVLTAEDVSMKRDFFDLVVSISGTDDSIRIANYFYADAGYRLNALVFSDGDTWGYQRVSEFVSIPTESADVIFGNELSNNINGFGGNDQVFGGDGDDSIAGGIGQDTLHGDSGNDILSGGLGNDTLYGGEGSDIYLFEMGDGQDQISNYDLGAVDELHFGAGILAENVQLKRDYNQLRISISGTSDSIVIDSYFAQDGVYEYHLDALVFANGERWDYQEILDLVSIPTESNDSIYGSVTDDHLVGLGGHDYLEGREGNDLIEGGSGNDYLHGGDGNDTLIGGSDNDSFFGGAGNDTYLIDRYNGYDNIIFSSFSGMGVDKLLFNAGIQSSEITLTRNPVNVEQLNISFIDGSGSIAIGDYFTNLSDSDFIIEFADGTSWNKSYVINSLPRQIYGDGSDNLLTGGTGNDSIYGDSGNDTLDGGAGDDELQGDAGNDVYLFGYGDGSDRIFKWNFNDGVDTLQFKEGVLAENVVFTKDPYDSSSLLISLTGSSDQVRIYNYFNLVNQPAGDSFFVKLFDGTTFSNQEIRNVLGQRVEGTSSGDSIIGGTGDDSIYGHEGNDVIDGASGVDLIEGGDGDDSLYGGTGGDYLNGGSGNDFLDGGDGGDAIFGESGNDQILGGEGKEYVSAGSGDDTVYGGYDVDSIFGDEGQDNLYGEAGADYINGGVGNDLISGGADADSLHGDDGDDDISGEEGNDYLSGGAGNDTLSGGADADTLHGDNGDDALDGGDGSDNIFGEAGHDVLSGGEGADFMFGGEGNDTMSGGADNDLLVGDTGNDLINGNAGDDTLVGQDGVDTLHGGEGNDFIVGGDDGVDYLYGDAGNDNLIGGLGNNELEGGDGDDSLSGGDGDDKLNGGAGDDIYSFYGNFGADILADNSGSDTIVLGFLPEEIELVRDSNNLIISVASVTGHFTIQNYFVGGDNKIEKIQFSDETVWLSADIAAHIPSLIISGTTGDDSIIGTDGDDVIEALAGNDTVNAGLGNDSISGGSGNDSIIAAEGNDSVVGDEGNDYIELGDGADSASGGSGMDTIFGGASNDSILGAADDDLLFGGTGDDYLNGNLGNDVLRGDAGADNLFGEEGDDQLMGGDGNDSIYGGSGNDYLEGGNDHDYLQGADGADYFSAGKGDDQMFGDAGTDTLYAGDGNDSVYGGSENDQLYGENGADILAGGDGADTIYGGAGNDLLSGGEGNDYLNDGDGNDSLNGGEGDDSLTAGDGNDSLNGQTGNDTLWGASGEDTLYGEAGDDALHGGTGNDQLIGGTGNDLLEDESGDDVYTFASGFGQDTINDASGNDVIVLSALPADVSLSRNGADLLISITASSDSIRITNYFTAGKKVEQIKFSDNTIWNVDYVFSNFTMFGTAGNDTITGTQYDDLIDALAGNDSITGGLGNDTIIGGTGADTMLGGGGDDVYIVDDTLDVVTEIANEGFDTVRTSVTYTISANIENIYLLGTAAINGIGNTLNNFMYGNDQSNTLSGNSGNDQMWGYGGNDMLTGGLGADTMYGGLGNDTYYNIDNTGDVVVEYADEGIDLVRTTINYTLGNHLENLQVVANSVSGFGNELDNLLTGYIDASYLEGRAGNDTLDGGTGIDTLVGGTGNDTYILDNISDQIIENLNEGIDSVKAAFTFTLNDSLENLTLTSTGNGYGNQFNNVLIGSGSDNLLDGGGGDDTLNGGAGADTLIGGAGNDQYYVDIAADIVTENANEGIDTVFTSFNGYVLAANVENLTVSIAGSLNVTGNDLNNIIIGSGGGNWIDGGLGIDTMIGGAGTDTYKVDNSADVIIEEADTLVHKDRVEATANYVLSEFIEELTLLGSATHGTGNSSNNTIRGNDLDNYLDGGAGNDNMQGGAGNDTYVVDSVDDSVVDTGTDTADTILASVSYTLSTSIEKLVLTGNDAINGTGSLYANTIIGNSAANILNGAAGADTLIGGAGDDTYIVDNVGDVVTENANEGYDTVNSSVTRTLGDNLDALTLTGTGNIHATGNALDNYLMGNTGNNNLIANAGNDTLNGGAGTDNLTGGTGNDLYLFGRGYAVDTIFENDSTAGNTDVVQLGADIAVDQLWFSHVGNNLEISIVGTSDKLVVNSWYSGSAYQVEQIKLSNGSTLVNTQVEALVSAMAAFAPPSGAGAVISQDVKDQLQSVWATSWQ